MINYDRIFRYCSLFLDLKNSLMKLETIEKDNQKLQKIQEKSRKAKDVEMLFAENDMLQKRLLSQEEQFRLQNQTLMNELTLVTSITLSPCFSLLIDFLD